MKALMLIAMVTLAQGGGCGKGTEPEPVEPEPTLQTSEPEPYRGGTCVASRDFCYRSAALHNVQFVCSCNADGTDASRCERCAEGLTCVVGEARCGKGVEGCCQ